MKLIRALERMRDRERALMRRIFTLQERRVRHQELKELVPLAQDSVRRLRLSPVRYMFAYPFIGSVRDVVPGAHCEVVLADNGTQSALVSFEMTWEEQEL